ncbi:uncharacterized protein LOC124365607 [Homalodisca vitripennis]|uniref:uncharacterized protein LOC124365607 n=1 Tax=Homalodisca vitripennis TaxID=197043 RepID=UPI001EEA225C|nr:uncharacterized protein LOC124365607 [Homalodisca vitripennis]
MADLQKCLPTPALTNCQSFYLRKLWTLNYTIDDSSGKKTWCMIWNETTAGRGGSEMASCLFTWANEELNKSSIDTLTVLNPDCTTILVLPDNDSAQWNFNMHESENIQVERETSKDVHLLNFISTPVEPESNEWELETITQVTNMEQESGASTTLEDLDDALSSVSDLFENDIDDPTYTPPSGSESDST